ncbi:hypothetical protein BCR36DRAFT_412353 [Piromyces finnis]|uniref:Uncharacterized protein n=1 Tax=Piromyces finnis TaxID=1754191 RepID=A0A1Y1V9B2_9FUNG|nr:hypothetical protein BCR36DRAFT_412353 [Piromyces finnis]|eukprot:ORX50331.1 hypothetical protein BCR36DRAFT_412353 [Piromyces finnis]
MASVPIRDFSSKSFRFLSNMFLIFIISKVFSIRIDWIFMSIATTVIALWLCARSINAITREVDTKDIKSIEHRVDESISFMLLATLVYHFTILLMFISFARSQDTKFIVYKIAYLTVFELIPLFASCAFLFLRWKDNIKPLYLKISNYVFYTTLICLTGWVVYVFHLIWGSHIVISFTKNYTPLIICRLCSGLIIIFGLLDIINVPTQEYSEIYETKRVYIEKQKELKNKKVNNKEEKEKKEEPVTEKEEVKKDL